jgi:hypothetical protein
MSVLHAAIDWFATLLCAGFLLIAASGCAVAPEGAIDSPLTSRTGVEWCKEIKPGAAPWLTEARTRFRDPFILDCHGMDFGKGRGPTEWKLAPSETGMPMLLDADSVAWAMHALMPDRDVVLIVCNPHRRRITAPRVWYYPEGNVWSHPRWASNVPVPSGTGASIWQFVEGHK